MTALDLLTTERTRMELIEQFAQLDLQRQALVEEAKKFFADGTVDLDERWAVYVQAEQFLPTESFIADFENEALEDWFREMEIHRHEEVTYCSLDESLTDVAEWDDSQQYDYPELIKALRLHALSTGTRGFTFDW